MAEDVVVTATAVRSKLAAHVPLCALSAESLEQLGLEAGAVVELRGSGEPVYAWCMKQEASPPPNETRAELSGRVQRRLAVSDGDTISIRPGVPTRRWPTKVARLDPLPVDQVRTAKAREAAATSGSLREFLDDVPAGAGSVHVLSHDGVAFPVTLPAVRPGDDVIELGFYPRLLLGIQARAPISLWALSPEMQTALSAGGREAGRSWRARARALVETTLQRMLGTPELAFRVTHAQPGDEYQGVCRLHKAMLTILGVEAGDRLRVRWAHREGLVRVHEHAMAEDPANFVKASSVWRSRTDDVPTDFLISVPHTLLARLGAPRDAVVLVRRDALSLVAKNSIRLSLPLAGLLLGLSRTSVPWWSLTAIVIGLVVIAFLPLRLATDPLRVDALPRRG